jgi:3-oxoacyl-[acyl-carrier-protein] synthase-3
MKLGPNVRIKTVAKWLPETTESVDVAISAGKLDEEEVTAIGVTELPVSETLSGPELAVAAGRRALERSGWDAGDLDLVIHNWIYHQGHDMWSPPHYVAHQLGARAATPYGLQQGCNAGVMAVQQAGLRLLVEDVDRVLVTTGDRFCAPGIDRWCSDYSLVFGDAGTAALLHRGDGGVDEFSLLSLATSTESEFEEMLRGDDPFSPSPMTHSPYINLRRPKKAYLAAGGKEKFDRLSQENIAEAFRLALSEAEIELDDPRIRCLVLPRLGDSLLDVVYGRLAEQLPKADSLRFGGQTGHLGCGDFLANLADVHAQDVLGPGDIAVVVGGGAAFTWMCAVLQAPIG